MTKDRSSLSLLASIGIIDSQRSSINYFLVIHLQRLLRSLLVTKLAKPDSRILSSYKILFDTRCQKMDFALLQIHYRTERLHNFPHLFLGSFIRNISD